MPDAENVKYKDRGGTANPSHATDRSKLPKVLILGLNYAPEYAGIAPYTTAIARGLAANGHQVRVVTGYPHYPAWKIPSEYRGSRRLRRDEMDGDVRVTRVRHPVPRNPTGIARVLMEVVFSIRAATVRLREDPDVIIVVSPALLTVLAGLRWKRCGRAAMGVVIQDLYSLAIPELGLGGRRVSLMVTKLESWLIRQADSVAVIHEGFKTQLSRLRVPDSCVVVLRNWAHLGSGPKERSQELRESLGWAENETVVLHAGNMGRKQGLSSVVEAARLVDAREERIRFVLLGKGPQRAGLERASTEVRSIQFLDPVPDAQFLPILSAADILLVSEIPGVVEMCVPSKLTSYFSVARPVVAATAIAGAAAKEIEAADAGWRTEPGDARALLETVLMLRGKPDTAILAGQRGADYAARVLSADSAIDRYCNWIAEILVRSERVESNYSASAANHLKAFYGVTNKLRTSARQATATLARFSLTRPGGRRPKDRATSADTQTPIRRRSR